MNTKNQKETKLGQRCNKTTYDNLLHIIPENLVTVILLSNNAADTKNGNDVQVTCPLDNTSPVNFQIQLQSSGFLGIDSSTWKGLQGDTVGITIVPEFGSIVSAISTMSFMIVVFLMKRSKINFLQFGKQIGM